MKISKYWTLIFVVLLAACSANESKIEKDPEKIKIMKGYIDLYGGKTTNLHVEACTSEDIKSCNNDDFYVEKFGKYCNCDFTIY